MGSKFATALGCGCLLIFAIRRTFTHMHTNPDSVSPLVATPAWQESPAAEVDDSWLSSSDQDRSIRRNLRVIFYDELWHYRGLLYELMRRDIRVRYKQTALGFAWAMLMPSLIVLAGGTVRYAMAYVGGRHLGVEDLAGIAIKAVPWSFFVGSMGFATASLVGQANLVTKIYFPREVLPLAATMAQAFDASLGVVSLLIAFAVLGVDYGLAALWAPALVAVRVLPDGRSGAARQLRESLLPRRQVPWSRSC